MNILTKIEVIVGVLIALLSGAVWVGALTTQIKVLERDYEDMKEENKTILAEIQNLKQQAMNPALIKVFETQLTKVETRISEVQQTVDRLKITELQTQVTGVKGKLNQLNQTLPNLKIKLGEVSQQALSLQKDYDAIKQQKQNTMTQLHNIETKIAEVQQTVDKLKITELQTQVTDVEDKLNQTLAKVKQEIKIIQQNIKAEIKIPAPGAVIRDRLNIGGFGPEMVIIPAGSFNMGGNNVSVEQFAMGKYEVTFDEYDKFAEATGRSKPDDEGWGRGNRPVINVSWYDATAYAKWLNNQTGKTYRLPTEAEWEYAARAGTTTKYWWGNDIGKNKANCYGSRCGDNFKYTAPVGSFSANPFGLYDTSGNVWEWTCSEYEAKYNGKEKVCISKKNNKYRVLRGGSWNDGPRDVRTASRGRNTPDFRNDGLGFRVVLVAAWT